jgi:hypothetical protein
MVYKFGTSILEWNVKFLHYVDSIFIFVDKFLSQSGAIFLFHSNDLQVFKQIKELLDNYFMSIRMKRAVANNLPLCSIKDPRLKVHLPSHIFSLLLLLLVFCSNL